MNIGDRIEFEYTRLKKASHDPYISIKIPKSVAENYDAGTYLITIKKIGNVKTRKVIIIRKGQRLNV